MKNADFSPNCTGQLDIYVLIPDFQGTVWVKLTHVIHIDPLFVGRSMIQSSSPPSNEMISQMDRFQLGYSHM